MSQLIERAVVKPLEWERQTEKMYGQTYRHWRAVNPASGGFLWINVHTEDFDGPCSGDGRTFNTAAEAMNKCQDSYEARILSALTQPSPNPTAAGEYVLAPVEQFRGEVLWALRQGARIGATPDELAKTILDCPALASRPSIGEPVPGAGEWQPIETAPKSGPAFLVWCPERFNIYLVGSDHDGDYWQVFGGRRLETERPTHWQPLPAPPATEPTS